MGVCTCVDVCVCRERENWLMTTKYKVSQQINSYFVSSYGKEVVKVFSQNLYSCRTEDTCSSPS
jgi:hypothetical protein